MNSSAYRLWREIDGVIFLHSLQGKGKLLDFGCNGGRGMVLYSINGFYHEGLELIERATQYARMAGFIVYIKPLEKFQIESFLM